MTYTYEVYYAIAFDDLEQEEETGYVDVEASSSLEAEQILMEKLTTARVGWRRIEVQSPMKGSAT